MLTRLERLLLKAALKPETLLLKWSVYLAYTVLALCILAYFYVFFTTHNPIALERVLFFGIVLGVVVIFKADQSLIRKLKAGEENDPPHR